MEYICSLPIIQVVVLLLLQIICPDSFLNFVIILCMCFYYLQTKGIYFFYCYKHQSPVQICSNTWEVLKSIIERL